MTVASLWKVLDNAGCGVHVGAKELMSYGRPNSDLINPWTYNKSNRDSKPNQRPVLAIDLSIWICEALTSQAIAANHANPALHLTYTRALKLLGMGVKLVVVIEGKRRVRRTEEPDTFRKRRAGTAFWNACNACEKMFESMGVPIVKAKAEGEALCALLNQRGIVDGVISNDGDCLLFGAKVVYTKFSIENLLNSQVVRYESSNLFAVVEDEDDESRDANGCGKISLSRHDLISFALLTGSDLAGNGFPNIGHKKAVRFIHKCKHDHPLSTETAAIDEMRSWSRTGNSLRESGCIILNVNVVRERCCAICSHPGDKRSHLKHGCEVCGTGPGECCFQFTVSDRFRLSLRASALAQVPAFAPAVVVDAYLKPNDGSIPLVLEGESAASVEMRMPSIHGFLALNLIVKGQSHSVSREYVIDSLSRLLVRRDLFGQKKRLTVQERRCLSKELPVPILITRQLVRDKAQCFEVTWRVEATITDSDGKGIDGYEFSTIEEKEVIAKRFPDLVAGFREAALERQKQGNAERSKRKDFVEGFLQCHSCDPENGENDIEYKQGRRRLGKRKQNLDGFFEGQRESRLPCKLHTTVEVNQTSEMKALMRPFIELQTFDEYDYSTITSGSKVRDDFQPVTKATKQYGRPKPRVFEVQPLGMTIAVIQSTTDVDLSFGRQPQEDGAANNPRPVDLNCNERQPERDRAASSTARLRPEENKRSTLAPQVQSPSVPPRSGSPSDLHLISSDQNHLELKKINEPNKQGLTGGIPNLALEILERSLNVCSTRRIGRQHESLADIKCFEFDPNPEVEHNTPELGEEMSLTAEQNRVRPKKVPYIDPDAWMGRFVSSDGSTVASEPNIIRRLQFDDICRSQEVESATFPSLTPGQHHLIVCDMGIPISVTPLLTRASICQRF